MLLDKGIDWEKYILVLFYGIFARKVSIQYKYTSKKIKLLPPKHNTRKNPDLFANKNVILILNFTVFKKF